MVKKPALTLEETRQRDISKGRYRNAIVNRIADRSRAQAGKLIPSKMCRGLDGLPIVKKGGRKHRYLMVFPGLLLHQEETDPTPFGSITELDTPNPVLYIQFEGKGRLRLDGTIVYPKNRYAYVLPATKKSMVCEEVFENVIVFSDAYWVGTVEENPTDKPLPFPADIAKKVVQNESPSGAKSGLFVDPAPKNFFGKLGNGADEGEDKDKDRKSSVNGNGDMAMDGTEDRASSGSDVEIVTDRVQRTPRRSSLKKVSYKEADEDTDGDDSGSTSGGDSDAMSEASGSAAPRPSNARRGGKRNSSGANAGKGEKQGGLAGSSKQSTLVKSRKRKVSVGSSDDDDADAGDIDDESDVLSGDDDDDAGAGGGATSRGRRKSGVKVGTNMSEDEDGSDSVIDLADTPPPAKKTRTTPKRKTETTPSKRTPKKSDAKSPKKVSKAGRLKRRVVGSDDDSDASFSGMSNTGCAPSPATPTRATPRRKAATAATKKAAKALVASDSDSEKSGRNGSGSGNGSDQKSESVVSVADDDSDYIE